MVSAGADALPITIPNRVRDKNSGDGTTDRAVEAHLDQGFSHADVHPTPSATFRTQKYQAGRRSKLTKLTKPLAQRFRQFCRFQFLSPREISHCMKSSPRWSIGIGMASPPTIPARAPGMTMTPGDRS
jgi:hypothetical protein